MPARVRRPQASSNPTGNRCNLSVVLTLLRANPKRCLLSLNYCSGYILFRYIHTALRGSVNDVVRYRGSRNPLPGGCDWAFLAARETLYRTRFPSRWTVGASAVNYGVGVSATMA